MPTDAPATKANSGESKQDSGDVLNSGDNAQKNPKNVAGGLKSTLKNPNVSDEAKDNAKQRLAEMDEQ